MAPFIRVFPLSPLGLARSGEVLSDCGPPYAFSITYGCSVSSVGADGNVPLRMETQEVLEGGGNTNRSLPFCNWTREHGLSVHI